jgi:hypothetical protein
VTLLPQAKLFPAVMADITPSRDEIIAQIPVQTYEFSFGPPTTHLIRKFKALSWVQDNSIYNRSQPRKAMKRVKQLRTRLPPE